MKEKYIAVLDSGIGGFSVLLPLMKMLPKERYVYYMDKANFPYGKKSRREIVDILEQNINQIMSKYPVKLIILACNTATTSAINELRRKLCVQIVGISPLDCSLTGDEIIFCTKLTAKNLPKSAKIMPCNNLATQIENNIFCPNKLKNIIQKTFKPYANDRIVLGCTHYLLVKNIISEIYPNITIVDNSSQLLHNIVDLLDRLHLRAEFNHKELVVMQS